MSGGRRGAGAGMRRGLRSDRGEGGEVGVPEQLSAAYWWDPDVGVTLETGVASWQDRIAGVSVAQSNTTLQPAIGTSARTGRTMLMPDGSYDRLFSDDAALAAVAESAHTVYIEVAGSPAAGGATHVSFGDTGGGGTSHWCRLYRNANRAQFLYAGTSTHAVNGSVVADVDHWLDPHWMYQERNGNVTVGMYNAAPPVSTALTASFSGIERFCIGARVVGGTTNFAGFTSGEIGHVVVFDRALSAEDHATMQAWLEGLWP